MATEYTVKVRKIVETDNKLTVEMPGLFGEDTELLDKALYRRIASGTLADTGMPGSPVSTTTQIVSVYRGDVRVYPHPRKTAKDKPTKPAQTAEDKKVQDAPESE